MKDNFSEKDISFEFFDKEEADDFEESLKSVLNGRSDIEFKDGLCLFSSLFCSCVRFFLEDDDPDEETDEEEVC